MVVREHRSERMVISGGLKVEYSWTRVEII